MTEYERALYRKLEPVETMMDTYCPEYLSFFKFELHKVMALLEDS